MARAKEAASTVAEKTKVELAETKEGIHTVFTKSGRTEFVDGVAEVDSTVAGELKETGLVK